MAITKGIRTLVAEANAVIETISVEDAQKRLNNPDTQFVDLRDVRELWREGTIPGALHVPRGMLEFWVDPDSPYHKPVFASGKQFVLFCGSGWRSALAARAIQEMGLDKVAHIDGGFTAWKDATGNIQAVEKD